MRKNLIIFLSIFLLSGLFSPLHFSFAQQRFFSDEGAVWLGNQLPSYNIFETILGDTLAYCRSYAGVYVLDVNYQTGNTEVLSYLPTFGTPENIEGFMAVYEPYIYICTNSGMFIYDVSDPYNPVQTRAPLNCNSMPVIVDSILFVNGLETGVPAVEAYDLRINPGDPVLIDTFAVQYPFLTPYENYVIADGYHWIKILELQNDEIVEVCHIDNSFEGLLRCKQVSDGKYYRMTNPQNELFYQVFDISDPGNIQDMGYAYLNEQLSDDFYLFFPLAIINVAENVDAFSSGEYSMILDVTDPANPEILDTLRIRSEWKIGTYTSDSKDSSFVTLSGHSLIVVDINSSGSPGNEEYSLELRYQERGPIPYKNTVGIFNDRIFHETQDNGFGGMILDVPFTHKQYTVNENAELEEILSIEILSGSPGNDPIIGSSSRRFSFFGHMAFHLFDLDISLADPVYTVELDYIGLITRTWFDFDNETRFVNFGRPVDTGPYNYYYFDFTDFGNPVGPSILDFNGADITSQAGKADTLFYAQANEDSIYVFDMTDYPAGPAINVFYTPGAVTGSPICTGAGLMLAGNSVFSIASDPVNPEYLCELQGTKSDSWFLFNWAIHDSGYVAGAGPNYDYALYDLRNAPDYEIIASWRCSNVQGDPEEIWWCGDTLWIAESTTLSAYRFPAIDDIPVVNENSRNPYRPNAFELLNPYPNPFNSSTKISFIIYNPAPIQLSVYDILGRQVYNKSWPYLQPGKHTQTFSSQNLSSGLYFVRLGNKNEVYEIRKVVLIK